MRVRTVLTLLLLMLYPATAHAWWWDYFDGLSGPGPFKTVPRTPPVEVIVWFNPSADDPNANKLSTLLLDDPSQKRQWYLAVRRVRLNNDQHPQMFENQPLDRRHVDLTTHEISLMYRVSSVLDVGVGASILTFSGEGFDTLHRVGPIGKVTVTPFGDFIASQPTAGWKRRSAFWALRSPKLYVDYTVFKGFEAREFGNAAGAKLPSVEGKWRAGLLIDATSLFCSITACKTR